MGGYKVNKLDRYMGDKISASYREGQLLNRQLNIRTLFIKFSFKAIYIPKVGSIILMKLV